MRARIAGADLSYEVRGTGPVLLLLHAFPVGMAMWDEPARALSARFQVVRFDCRGFGGSPSGEGLLTMERIADDAAALLDHLGLPSAAVGGVSMGGYAALAFVRRHPTRLRALVLADTKAAADTDQARATRAEQADEVRRRGVGFIAETMVPRLVGPTTLAERPAVVARLREIVLANPARGITDALAGLAARADSTPTLREIRVPTLVVVGAEDALTPIADAEALRAGIAGSTLEVVPRAGHLACMEAPAEFTAVVEAFLRTA